MYRKVQFTATDYTDYMFTNKNLIKYCKSMLVDNNNNNNEKTKNIEKESTNINSIQTENKILDKFYRPKQSDTLFWCFYILKNGYSNYEMEINGQYFTVEKQTKINM